MNALPIQDEFMTSMKDPRKRYKARMRKQGRCIDCGDDKTKGKARCAPCGKLHAVRSLKSYHKTKSKPKT